MTLDISLPLCRDRLVSFKNGKNSGSSSNMKDYPISVIGVVPWKTVIRIVSC